MRFFTTILIAILSLTTGYASLSPKQIFRQNRKKICLVSFYQNISSDSKIGSFNKIKRYRIGVLVDSAGLVMVSSDVYPVSLDIISRNGSLLSGKPSDFKVKLWNGKEYPAEFLGKDDQSRVAFIRFSHLPAGLHTHFARFIPSGHLSVGDTIFVLELLPRTYQFKPLFTPHIIGAVVETPRRKFLVKEYSTALSAGGLVLDGKGRAVGVTLKRSLDFSFQPPEDFEEFRKDFLEIAPSDWFRELIHHPPVIQENQIRQKSWLGIRMQGLTPGLQKYWNVPQKGGVVIDRVYPESPAQKAGLETGDVILQVNDSTLRVQKDEETDRLRNLIRSIPPGNTVRLKIFRQGKILHKKVRLTAAPKAVGLAESYPVPRLGFELRELTRDILYEQNLPLSTPGVFVYQVDRASPAGIAGLPIGAILQQINETPINNLDDARKMIEAITKTKSKKIMLKVLDNRSTRFVFIDLSG